MAKENQNASVYQGDTLTLEFTVKEGGAPKNLTGGTMLYEARFPTPLAKGNAGLDLSAQDVGKVRVHYTEAETRAQKPGEYDHALQVALAGETEHVATGKITVKKEIAE